MERRKFIRQTTGLALLASLPGIPFSLLAEEDEVRIIILHTNDTHSRIEPFPDDGRKYGGMGGIARRATLIKQIRQQYPNVLLLDSGDILQGTPYFNFFKGEVEFTMMSEMGYDATTLGNHEFDNGAEPLAEQMRFANFPFINSNYDFMGSPLEGKIIQNKIFEFKGVRIGVFGLGIELEGLVLKRLYGNIEYKDPVKIAEEQVEILRKKNNCDLVICLSHLGYSYPSAMVDDKKIAARVNGIDIILGGHTHTFLEKPAEVVSPSGKKTLVNQTGFGGICVGKIEILFSKSTGQKSFQSLLLPLEKNLVRI